MGKSTSQDTPIILVETIWLLRYLALTSRPSVARQHTEKSQIRNHPMEITSHFDVDYHGGFQTPEPKMYNVMLSSTSWVSLCSPSPGIGTTHVYYTHKRSC